MNPEFQRKARNRQRSNGRGPMKRQNLSCQQPNFMYGTSKSPSYSPNHGRRNMGPAMSVSVAMPQLLYGSPKQFIITKPERLSSSDDEESEDSSLSVADHTASSDKLPNRHMDHFDKEFFTFCDLDYEMPPEVRRVLQEEGLDNSTVEAWLRRGEVWHQRAMALRRFQSAKLINAMAKKQRALLPPISSMSSNGPISKQEDEVVQNPPSLKYGANSLPDIQTTEQQSKKKLTAREEIMMLVSEAEDIRWKAEQQQERILMPVEFVFPRLVIISSKVPWCHGLSKTVRKEDGNILSFIYDFESWTFDDIIEASRDILDRYYQGCRVKSIVLLCKGGPGYFYMLKNFVMTPQKMLKPRYKYVKRFWQQLGDMVSKIDPDEAKLHVIGADLESNTQGQKLIRSILRAIHPNRLDLETPLVHTPKGRECIELYFDYHKFLLWRSRSESELSFLDAKDGNRSWSSIEEEIQRRERLHDILNSTDH